MYTPEERIVIDDELKGAFRKAADGGSLDSEDQQEVLFNACSPELQARFFMLLREFQGETAAASPA